MNLKEFEKILRTETGEELESEEIRMVQQKMRFNNSKHILKGAGAYRFYGRSGTRQGESKGPL